MNRIFALALTALTWCGLCAPLTAENKAVLGFGYNASSDASSLDKVPADVAFYASTMRLGEQVDVFLKTNAYAKLKDLPAVKMALQHLAHQIHQPGNDMAKIIEFFHAPENKDLANLVHNLWRQEIFIYGGEDFVHFIKLAADMNSGSAFMKNFTRGLQAGMAGGNTDQIQAKNVLDAIKNSKNVVLPDVVFGFKLSQTEPAVTQLKRLEGILRKQLAKHEGMQDRLKPFGSTDSPGFTVELDGSLLPWEKIGPAIEHMEEESGEYKPVIEKLKGLKFAFTAVVKGEFLLFNLGSGSVQLARFGNGAALASRDEFKPLKAAGDKKLTSVTYSSAHMAAELATKPEDIASMMKGLKEQLDNAPISEQMKTKIGKDFDALGKEMAAELPATGATMSYEFLTGHGTEGFAYHFVPGNGPSKPLSILDQVGGNPLVLLAGRGHDCTSGYKKMVKWIVTFYERGLEIADEMGQGEAVKDAMAKVIPFLKRFDDITGNKFLPSMADGQTAFVMDAKWQSSAWFLGLDQKGASLPMGEFGLVKSLSDSAAFVDALKDYRKLINDVMEFVRDNAPFAGEVKDMPAAQTKSVSSGTMYWWPIPEGGQDKQIQPNFAVSKNFMAITLSEGHSDRLLKSTTPGGDFKRLAGDRYIAMASSVDFSGLVAAARPWIEKVGVKAALEQMPEGANLPPGMQKADIPLQVATLIDVLSSLKRFNSVTYKETGATVTHYETVLEDVK